MDWRRIVRDSIFLALLLILITWPFFILHDPSIPFNDDWAARAAYMLSSFSYNVFNVLLPLAFLAYGIYRRKWQFSELVAVFALTLVLLGGYCYLCAPYTIPYLVAGLLGVLVVIVALAAGRWLVPLQVPARRRK